MTFVVLNQGRFLPFVFNLDFHIVLSLQITNFAVYKGKVVHLDHSGSSFALALRSKAQDPIHAMRS